MRFISRHITPLVINSLRRGHTHTHTHTRTRIPTIRTGSILRNQAHIGRRSARTWFKKDSYAVPQPDKPQRRLAGKKSFSKLDLRNANWQFPIEEESNEKTAFCPGSGYGLWEFIMMPYGLTGATQTCQRALDDILNVVRTVLIIMWMTS